MSKWIATIVASMFALSAASGFAAQTQTGYKKEDLNAEQKSEIRDRAARLKAERMKAETANPATPAAPAKASAPKRSTETQKPTAKTSGVKMNKTLKDV